MGKTGAVSVKQTAAIAALLEARNVADAAQRCGTPTRTIYRWLLEQPFKQALQAAETALIDESVRRLLQLQQHALDALQDVLTSPDTSPAVKVAAAGRVLDGLLKLRELRSVEERLQALEAQLTAGGAADNTPTIVMDM